MPSTTDPFRDERKAIENLIASTPLRTDKRLVDSSAGGLAAAHDPRPVLQVWEFGDLSAIEAIPQNVDIHRRYQVRAGSPMFEQVRRGQPARPSEKMLVHFVARFGYGVAYKGTAYGGTPTLIDEVAAEDLLLVYQRLMHWDNRTAGTSTGVARANTDIVYVGAPIRIIETPARHVWEMPVTSRVEITTEASSG